MKFLNQTIGLLAVMFLVVSLNAGDAFAKKEQVKIKSENIDLVVVPRLGWDILYYIDRKAKLCFVAFGQGGDQVPCKNLRDGYPELKTVINWIE